MPRSGTPMQGNVKEHEDGTLRVWHGISLDRKTMLEVLQEETLTAVYNKDELLNVQGSAYATAMEMD